MLVNNITKLEVKIIECLKKLLLEHKDYGYVIYKISNCLEEIDEKNRLKVTIGIINNNDFDKVLNVFVKDNKLDIKSFPVKYLTDSVTELFLVYCSENNIIYDNLEDDVFSDDLFSLYINDIIKYPLLTDAEQEELLLRIKKGDEDAKKDLLNVI